MPGRPRLVSELHRVLYFQPKRTASLLSAQAEYQTRILPAFAEQFRAETSRCTHRAGASERQPLARCPMSRGTAGRGRPPVRRPRLARVPDGAGLEDPGD